MTLREAGRQDRSTIAAICRAVAPQYDSILPGAFEAFAESLEKGEAPANYTLYLLDRDGDTVGFLGAARPSSETVYLVALYLLPTVQRQGLGGEAVRRLFTMDAYRGATTLLVQAHEQAEWAVAFYERLGLRVVARGREAIMAYGEGLIAPFALPDTVLLSVDALV